MLVVDVGKGDKLYLKGMRWFFPISGNASPVSWSCAVSPDISFIDKGEVQRWARKALTDNEAAGSHSFF